MDMKKAGLMALASLAVGFVAGYGAGRVSTGTPINPLGSLGGGSYQDGYNAAKKKLEDAHVFPPTPTSATTLNGTIKSVGSDSLVMETALSSPNPLEELNVPMERTVKIAADTAIDRQVPKTQEELQKEVAKYQADLQAGKNVPLPSPFKLEKIALSDLKPGDTVDATADHDILHEASFNATEIDLTTRATPPAPTPTGVPNGTAGPTGQTVPNGTPGPTGTPPPSTP